jgi:uncharacterized protein YdeI (YjbR/CyaY-like superfamily)
MARADDTAELHVTTRAEWREWLAARGAQVRAIWLVFNKAHTGKPRLTFDEAIEGALAVGWVDSIIKRLDDDRYAQKFTPRRPGSNWSPANLARARRLVAEGLMTEPGKALLPPDFSLETPAAPADRSGSGAADRWANWREPDWVLAAIAADERAAAAYAKLAPSHRRRYIGWATSAKRLETQEKRLREVVTVLAEGRELGMK